MNHHVCHINQRRFDSLNFSPAMLMNMFADQTWRRFLFKRPRQTWRRAPRVIGNNVKYLQVAAEQIKTVSWLQLSDKIDLSFMANPNFFRQIENDPVQIQKSFSNCSIQHPCSHMVIAHVSHPRHF